MLCRLCGSKNLAEFLDLGHHPPSNGFLTRKALQEPETHYPLNVLVCNDCGLSQLGYLVPRRVLFGPDYPYDSSTSRTFRNHFQDMAKLVTSGLQLKQDSLAIDIGSNVGVLLGGFKDHGLRVLGIEPADNMAAKANEQGIETLNDFFSASLAQSVASSHGKASVITGTNVFAHIDDLVDVVDGVRSLLAPGGAFVMEMQYFLDMVTHMEYDQIYHEHYSYMTVRPLTQFFQRNGMEVFDVQHVSTHGGSIRVFAGFPKEHPVSSTVKEFIGREEDAGIFKREALLGFAGRVAESRSNLLDYLGGLKAEGKSLVGMCAPAKANTILNYCKISTNILDYLTDNSPSKIDLYSPGMHIPVVSESRLLTDQPAYGVLLAWNIKDEMIAKFSDYRKLGGQIVVPIPSIVVV